MRENTKGAHLVSVLTAKSTHSDGAVVYSRLDMENAPNMASFSVLGPMT